VQVNKSIHATAAARNRLFEERDHLKQYLSIVDWKPVLNDNTPAAFEKIELIIREANDICCPTIKKF
jgi:hypothetical protein